jgi:serine/threonine protein kinase
MLQPSQLATLRNYTVTHLIGEGSYSQVYAAEDTLTHTPHAIKVIPRSFSTQAESEINILSSLSHRSCVHLYESLSDDLAYYLITDHVSNGTLLQHMNYSHAFPEHDARQIFAQLFDGIRYLHDVQQVAHLDLKLENVMIDSRSQVKIIDFGQARSFDALGRLRVPIRCGSRPYCAPEIISGRPVTPSVDIWSMGVILYTLVTGAFPFYTGDDSLLTGRILFDEVAFPRDVSPEFRSLVSKMLEKENTKRITLAEIAARPWMAEVAGDAAARKAFTLPRLEFLRASLPEAKIRPAALKRTARMLEIEQAFAKRVNGRRRHGNHGVPPVKTPVRSGSG